MEENQVKKIFFDLAFVFFKTSYQILCRMELSPGVSYQLARSGQQYGPYEGTQLISMAQSGDVLESDYIWAEGMADWVPASSLLQLAPTVSSEVTQAAVPITEPIHVKPQGRAVGAVSQRKEEGLEDKRKQEEEQNRLRELREREKLKDEEAKRQRKLEQEEEALRLKELKERNAREQREADERQRQREREEKERLRKEQERERELRSRFPETKPFYLLVLILLVGFLVGSIFYLAELETRSETYSFESVEAFTEFDYEEGPKLSVYKIGQGLAVVLSVLGVLLYIVLATRILFLAWKYLQDYPEVSTTPGKAVGFMFVPLFNILWIRTAFVKWKRDFHSTARHFKLETAPSLDRGLFRLPVIVLILFFPLLHPFLMTEMGRGTNFLARFSRDNARDNWDEEEEEDGDNTPGKDGDEDDSDEDGDLPNYKED